ncbi:FdrA protein [Streptosporangium subroseum]|uniref:FdrA protein n=1 Tax=Streptosporangium subroseum TaxID=106412 RepID=A0A239CE66_9ACTN|nr:FdrA family protein [Streptosporangium subroseum]SNS18182.1 FdrA protein [Streptosporangium subroseum]
MSTDVVRIRTGVYHDSVSLMRVSQALTALPGVEVAVVAMATELNRDIATELGFDLPQTGPADLLIALRSSGPDVLESADAELERLLTGLAGRTTGATAAERPPRTVRAAARGHGATLALVSVPGPYAFAEAMDAVEAGLSVMIFSDNVPVEQEVLLKRRAGELDVLVMGPDCGTAVIGGVGLGFANVLRPGPVGVVAASGTGAQQVTCLLDLAGVGVSHVLGVGGRDLSADVGALSTLRALEALDADPATELIILISKPPAPEVADVVREAVSKLVTPVVTALLGPGQGDLTAAAETALRTLGVPIPAWPSWPSTVPSPPDATRLPGDSAASDASGTSAAFGVPDSSGPPGPPGALETFAASGSPGSPGASDASDSPGSPGRTLRGIYSGGTLCVEARLIAGTGEFTDFGDDAYTRGRPHPMIDPSLRLEALAEVPPGAVVLLDVVLGHGADPDPSVRLAPAITAAVARGVPVVVVLVGSSGDPQGLNAQAEALHAAGATVFTSNARAAGYAADVVANTL